MNIFLFGVSNVGKSVTGKLLASRLRISFYDLDEELKNNLKTTLEEFVSSGTLLERDNLRCNILNMLADKSENKVVAVSPLSYIDSIRPLLSSENCFSIQLIDSADNIFDRLVFTDENDVIYEDADYKNAHKKYYLHEICEDLKWYGSVYSDIRYCFDMSGKTPEAVVDALIKNYHLDTYIIK